MHTMLTLQLDSYEADGTPLQRNTLSFVELAAPEPKVRVDAIGSNVSASEQCPGCPPAHCCAHSLLLFAAAAVNKLVLWRLYPASLGVC